MRSQLLLSPFVPRSLSYYRNLIVLVFVLVTRATEVRAAGDTDSVVDTNFATPAEAVTAVVDHQTDDASTISQNQQKEKSSGEGITAAGLEGVEQFERFLSLSSGFHNGGSSSVSNNEYHHDEEELAQLWRQLNEVGDDGGGGGGGALGDKCNDNTGCSSSSNNMECIDMGLVLGKRCAPLSCLREGMESLNSELLQQERGGMATTAVFQSVLAEAGITDEQVIEEFNDVVMKSNSATSSTTTFIENLRQSPSFATHEEAILRALLENHPDYTNSIHNLLLKCTGNDVNEEGTTPKTSEQLFYLGLHVELGAGVDISYSTMGGNLDMSCCPFGRVCGGAVSFGGQAGINLGMFLCGPFKDTGQIPGVWFMAEIDGAAGLAGSFSVGFGTQGYNFIEFGLGLGAHIGFGGSVCYVFAGGIDLPI